MNKPWMIAWGACFAVALCFLFVTWADDGSLNSSLNQELDSAKDFSGLEKRGRQGRRGNTSRAHPQGDDEQRDRDDEHRDRDDEGRDGDDRSRDSDDESRDSDDESRDSDDESRDSDDESRDDGDDESDDDRDEDGDMTPVSN